MMPQVTPDPVLDRLDKLYTYFNYFDVADRYEISFDEFVKRVDEGSWVAYLAI
jgi:hypothetical protein